MTLGASDSYSKLPQIDSSASPKPRQQSNVSFSSNYTLPSMSTKLPEPVKEDIDGALWLTELGLEQYIETFLTNLSSDGRIVLRKRLKQIRQQDLCKMNILDFDDQKFIMEHIRLILKHPFQSLLHRKESRMINSPAKRSPQKKVVKTIAVDPDPIITSAVSEAKTSDSVTNSEHKKSAEHIPVAKDTKTLQKEKAKANRRRRSFDNSVWQSISSLRTKEKQNALAAAQLREGHFENLSPQHSESKNDGNNSKKNAGRRRWSFNNEEGCGPPMRNIHDKATAYGNFALEFDMLQSSLKALEHEYLDKFCLMLNCEKASIFFLNEDSGDLLLFADNRTWYRIPKGSGLAGFCAETGQSLNVPDAYQDYRFNQ
ncbi:hypothetical protein EON65_14615 [archaeon]|nr:MAG: hypothetical protein EON65_14615 [archaeon]